MHKIIEFFNQNNIVYLDYNLFIDYISNNENKKDQIDLLKSDYIFLYSGAYLEELANTGYKNDESKRKEVIQKDLEELSRLTNNIGLRPSTDCGIVIVEEHPRFSYDRVTRFIDLTKKAEAGNEEFLVNRKMHRNTLLSLKIKEGALNGIEPKEIFFNKNLKDFLLSDGMICDLYLIEDKSKLWKELSNNYSKLEYYIEKLFNILELVGYNSEPNKKSRSRLHDVTHVIYATKANYFVTEDKKLKTKTEAIYSFLGVPAQVLEYKKFLQNKCETEKSNIL